MQGLLIACHSTISGWTNKLTVCCSDFVESLPPKDRGVFSFLWWNEGKFDFPPRAFECNSHPCGTTLSPLLCQSRSSKNRLQPIGVVSAWDDGDYSQNFYFDNLSSSVVTVAGARTGTPRILSNGGCELAKWPSFVINFPLWLATRRRCLTCIATRFDSNVFIAHLLLPVKLILQK